MLKQALLVLAALAAVQAADEAVKAVVKPLPEVLPVVVEELPKARALDLKPEAVDPAKASVVELQDDEEKPVSVPIIRSMHNVGDTDKWQESFRYEMPDGTMREESVMFRSIGDDKVPVVRGRSVWMAADGKRIEMVYEADENGFRAYGDHLPRLAGEAAVPAPETRREVEKSLPAPPAPSTPAPFRRPTPRPVPTPLPSFRPLPSPTPRPAPPLPISRSPSKPIRHRWA